MIENYFIHLLIMIGIYIILTLSLNLALGYTGLINLAHIALFGIGAYTSTLLTNANVPFLLAFIIAGLFTSLFGYFLVFTTNKLKGDYLAMATLGFSFVVFSLMLNLTEITRGPLGIPGIKKPEFFGFIIESNYAYLIFVAIICILSILIITKIIKSPFGRLLQATRDDELGLRILGKNTFSLKCKALMISAFFAGIAGSLFAHYITFIDPTSFALNELILVLTLVIVGGIASIKGSIIAPFIIIFLTESLRFLPLPSSFVGPLREIIYALALLLILYFKPRGIFGKVDIA